MWHIYLASYVREDGRESKEGIGFVDVDKTVPFRERFVSCDDLSELRDVISRNGGVPDRFNDYPPGDDRTPSVQKAERDGHTYLVQRDSLDIMAKKEVTEALLGTSYEKIDRNLRREEIKKDIPYWIGERMQADKPPVKSKATKT